MKAIRIAGPNRPLLVDTREPKPGPGEVLVLVTAVGLCATDRRLAASAPIPDLIPGHEVAGRLGDGTPVGIHPDIGCGVCRHCLAGYENRCQQRRSIGVDRDGGMAEWVAVPAGHAVPLEGVAPSLAPLLEPLACCIHAIDRLAVGPDDRVLLVGAGTMGLLMLIALKQLGVPVVVVQRSEERRGLARELGADAVVGMDADEIAAIGARPTAAVVTAPAAEAVRLATRAVEVGGRVHVFAGLGNDDCLDGNAVHYRHLTVVGSTGSRRVDYERARDLAATGAIDLSRLPVSRIRLDELPAHLSAPNRRAGKIIADVEGSIA